jgi:hypothetical protein
LELEQVPSATQALWVLLPEIEHLPAAVQEDWLLLPEIEHVPLDVHWLRVEEPETLQLPLLPSHELSVPSSHNSQF